MNETTPLPGIKLFDLTGRTALITGGSKGLGNAMAAGLASAGADVMLVSRHLDEAQAAAAKIAHDFGRKAIGHAADVTSPEQVDAMLAAAERELGKVDILINSAGINIRRPIVELKLEEFEQVLGINVTGTWLCCRAVLPSMRAQGWVRMRLGDNAYELRSGFIDQLSKARPSLPEIDHFESLMLHAANAAAVYVDLCHFYQSGLRKIIETTRKQLPYRCLNLQSFSISSQVIRSRS